VPHTYRSVIGTKRVFPNLQPALPYFG